MSDVTNQPDSGLKTAPGTARKRLIKHTSRKNHSRISSAKIHAK